MAKNAFDELLDSMGEDHRKALGEIAEQYPDLKSGYLRQSDYSRKMDEIRDKVTYAKQWEDWYSKNWDADAFGKGQGGTKREMEKARLLRDREEALKAAESKISELNQRVSVGGEVTFEELNSHLEKEISGRGLMKRDEVSAMVDGKAQGVEQMLTNSLSGYAHIATKGPKLMFKHYREFNEDLDLDNVLEHAAKNGIGDLEKAYDEFVSEKRGEVLAKKHQEEIEAAKKTAREEALKERGMSTTAMPDDNSGPTMGPMKARLLGLQSGADGRPDLSKAEMGRGIIAQEAARNWDRGE